MFLDFFQKVSQLSSLFVRGAENSVWPNNSLDGFHLWTFTSGPLSQSFPRAVQTVQLVLLLPSCSHRHAPTSPPTLRALGLHVLPVSGRRFLTPLLYNTSSDIINARSYINDVIDEVPF